MSSIYTLGIDVGSTASKCILLKDVKEDVDFENCMTLIDDRELDSFDIIQIVAALDDEYDIKIPASDIIPKNFNSAKAIYDMVQRLQNEQ